MLSANENYKQLLEHMSKINTQQSEVDAMFHKVNLGDRKFTQLSAEQVELVKPSYGTLEGQYRHIQANFGIHWVLANIELAGGTDTYISKFGPMRHLSMDFYSDEAYQFSDKKRKEEFNGYTFECIQRWGAYISVLKEEAKKTGELEQVEKPLQGQYELLQQFSEIRKGLSHAVVDEYKLPPENHQKIDELYDKYRLV